MSEVNLKERTGWDIEDNGELSNLNNIIEDFEDFIDQFSTHSMNNSGASHLGGMKEAYLDVIDYLHRIKPTG